MRKLLLVSSVILIMVGVACQPGCKRQEGEPWRKSESSVSFYSVSLKELEVITSQVIYVPVYSHIVLPGVEKRTLYLSATLSIRNTDQHHRIIITSIAYYDTNGALVEEYLPESFALAPLASTEIIVPQSDARGGSGANFLVQWAAETTVNEPIIEAIMAGTMGNYSFAFARPGRVVQQLPGKQTGQVSPPSSGVEAADSSH